MGLLDLFKKRDQTPDMVPEKKSIDTIKYSSSFGDTLKLCNEFGTDLVEMSEHGCTCGECAKYQGRVFSISGKDERFPKLPDSILKNGKIHKGCHHTFSPFIYGVSIPIYHKDIVEYSNKPFVDNRSADEITQYEKLKNEEAELRRDKKNYELLVVKLPDIAPKSFGGYRKMKNANSKNYIELVKSAKAVGIEL